MLFWISGKLIRVDLQLPKDSALWKLDHNHITFQQSRRLFCMNVVGNNMAQEKTGWIEGGFMLVDSFCLLLLQVLHGGEILPNHGFRKNSSDEGP